MENSMITDYSVFGLGKLGASMAADIAKRGFNVVGVDVIAKSVELVNAGHAPVQETNLEETIAHNKDRIRATLSHADAVLHSDVSFVIVPTLSDEHGAFSLQYAAWAFREIGKALKDKTTYHLVVLTSTVLPGSMRYGLLPILEEASGKKAGIDFGLCYSPEFIALGSILHDFLNPDFTLVGEYDEKSGALLEECYAHIMENHPPCRRMSFENAELTKVALNTFVTTKITYANMLVDICERLPGGDVDVVTAALGFDTRIGSKYLKGGIGYGGPCFPRDNVALGYMARALGINAPIAETTDKFNRALPGKITQRIKAVADPDCTIAVLGLAYKPYSHVIEESQGVQLVKELTKAGYRVVCYDPLARDTARAELAYEGLVLDSISACLEQANVVVITTADPEFKVLKADDFLQHRTATVIDFWRILSSELAGRSDIQYIPIGRSTNDEENAACLKALWGGTPQEQSS